MPHARFANRTPAQHILSNFYFKSDEQCKIAEQQDSETLRASLCFALNKICEDMPQLCVEIAGGNKNLITLEVIDKAEKISHQRFFSLGQHAWIGVRRAASQLEQLN